jgi:hypothetical protein
MLNCKGVIAVLMLFPVFTIAGDKSQADDAKAAKYTTVEVMKKGFKQGLLKTVTAGKATDDQKHQLLELVEALPHNKPPRGSEKSWQEKTEALVAAAKGVVDGDAGAADKLKTASNCGACHKQHKE